MQLDDIDTNKGNKKRQNRRGNNNAHKSGKKIDPKELEQLQKHFQKANNLEQRRAEICVQKELQMRSIEENFENEWELIEIEMKDSAEKRAKFIKELDAKYGKGKNLAYDLQSGNILEDGNTGQSN